MRVCSVPSCPEIYEGTTSRCERHETEAKQKHWAKTRAYSSKGHRAFRTAVLKRDPICVICHTRFSEVADHYPMERTELIEAGLNPNDPARGRGLCVPCHNSWTSQSHPSGWNDRA